MIVFDRMMLAQGPGPSGGFVATVAVAMVLAAWYWDSPWPVALGAAYLAIVALDIARTAARHSRLLWSLTLPARPLRLHWSFSVLLTDRAWDTMGVSPEQRPELQRLLGEYDPRWRSHLFKEKPTPAWLSRSIVVSYERWGDSLERWTILNSWVEEPMAPPVHQEKRVLEFLPAADEPDSIHFWGSSSGPNFRFQDGRLLFLNRDEHAMMLPDGRLDVVQPEHVLFDILAPSLSMSRRRPPRTEEPNPLDRFAVPNNAGVDGFDPGFYHRGPGRERFECENWDQGFRWELEVNDLRRCLDARTVRVHRSLWRRQVTSLSVELRDGGVKLAASPLVVEPTADGRTLPKKGESVLVVLDDEGNIDRIWLRR